MTTIGAFARIVDNGQVIDFALASITPDELAALNRADPIDDVPGVPYFWVLADPPYAWPSAIADGVCVVPRHPDGTWPEEPHFG